MLYRTAAKACALDGDTFYVAGGISSSSSFTFSYNVGENKWANTSSLHYARHNAGLSVIGGVLTVLGGSARDLLLEEFNGIG